MRLKTKVRRKKPPAGSSRTSRNTPERYRHRYYSSKTKLFILVVIETYCLCSTFVVISKLSSTTTISTLEQRLGLFPSTTTTTTKTTLNHNNTQWQHTQGDDSSFSSHQSAVSPNDYVDISNTANIDNNNIKEEEEDIRICFITCEFADSIDKADILPIVDSSMRRNPSRHFVYTNLPLKKDSDDDNGGWQILSLPENANEHRYKRLITKSRWGKFMAFKDKRITDRCDVVFYGDAYLLNPIDESYWQRLASLIVTNTTITGDSSNKTTGGLMQRKQPYTHDIQQELRRIIKGHKDSTDNIAITRKWFQGQDFFIYMRNNHHAFTVYKNAFFGYDIHNLQYQKMANDFWSIYSQEFGSYRDQPYWSYFLALHNIQPLLFPKPLPDYLEEDDTDNNNHNNNNKDVLSFGKWGRKGHGGHVYT